MKKIFLVLVFVFVAYGQQHVEILHWNDFHSQNLPFRVKTTSRVTHHDTSYFVGGCAVLSAYIEKYDTHPASTLLLDAGDDFQGTPISSITKGESQIELLSLLHPDAMAIGNHEFDYGSNSLHTKLDELKFPVLSANLVYSATGNSFEGTYCIKKVNGVTVAIIGLMTTELPALTLPANITGLHVLSPSKTVNDLIPKLKTQGADLIIALTHEGVQEDSILATECPDLDVIVGGHSHTPLFVPKRVNNILIVQAGSRGRWLGKVDLTVDIEKDTVITSDAELIECRSADVVPNPAVADKVDSLESLASASLNEVIGKLSTDWIRSSSGESNIGNWMTDCMRQYAHTDIAIQNSGGIRKDLLAGPITVRDLWEVCPFGNTLVTFTVSGKTLRKIIEHQLRIGDDFCQVSGISYTYSENNGVNTLIDITVGEKPVDVETMYTIVTNNFVASQSMKYFGILLNDSDSTPLNVVNRDILIDAVKKQKIIDPSIEGRIRKIQG